MQLTGIFFLRPHEGRIVSVLYGLVLVPLGIALPLLEVLTHSWLQDIVIAVRIVFWYLKLLYVNLWATLCTFKAPVYPICII